MAALETNYVIKYKSDGPSFDFSTREDGDEEEFKIPFTIETNEKDASSWNYVLPPILVEE